jgi:hypothetical protein
VPQIQNRLTDRNLRALKPDPLRAYDLPDGGDLYVRVETSGTVVFWLRYQLNGKRRRWAIGHYGTGKAGISLTEAHGKRDEAKKLLRDGIDPWGHKLAEDLVAARAREELEEAERRGARRQGQTVAWLLPSRKLDISTSPASPAPAAASRSRFWTMSQITSLSMPR